MWELVKAGGWMMLPIILSSIVALAIVFERFLVLRKAKVAPRGLLDQVWAWLENNQLDNERLKELRAGSPLGEILASGLANARHGREVMKESIEETAARVVHELERYLTVLGSIAAIAPLLGLLGTVIGMIKIFSAFLAVGGANPDRLAGGISTALVTTAAGLMVAIPALFFHRYLVRHVDELVVGMEQEAIKLVEIVQNEGLLDPGQSGRNAWVKEGV